MKVLKKIFKKKSPPILILPKLKIKPKQGKWCDCYEGRLPYPIECQSNKQNPVSSLFESGEITLLHDRTVCVECNRFVEWQSWKRGEWDKVKEAIANCEDLRDMDPPIQEMR